MDYHVRHHALPRPGGERELGQLVSRLHSHRLNRRRPLWECHVIEGLENHRFAIYTKIHHALADGVTTMRLLTQSLAKAPESRTSPFWATAPDKPSVPAAPAAHLPTTGRASGRERVGHYVEFAGARGTI